MAGITWRYFRLYITAVTSGSEVGINLMKLSATSGGSSLLTGGTATASSQYSGSYLPSYAFDATSNYWYSQGSTAPPHWLKYDMGSGNTASPRYLYLEPYTTATPTHPYSFELQGSDDDSAWTTLLSATAVGYGVTDRWSTGTAPRIELPFGYKVAGNSTHDDTDPTSRVVVFNWTTGRWIDTVTPDGAGDYFSVFTGPNDVGVVHIGDSGYQPQADGPITPSTI